MQQNIYVAPFLWFLLRGAETTATLYTTIISLLTRKGRTVGTYMHIPRVSRLPSLQMKYSVADDAAVTNQG